jgi:predicted ribosome quality control (RQC) complex YloA/Tae2 family protein
LAEYRRRELLRTISAVRNTSAKERRRAKAAIRQEVDDLIGSVKAADAANMLPPVAEKANTSSEPSGAPISSAQS